MVKSVLDFVDFAEAALRATTRRKSHKYPATTAAAKHFLCLLVDNPLQNVSAEFRHFVAIPRKDLLVVGLVAESAANPALNLISFAQPYQSTFLVHHCICCH
jgi:hypothetical protein